MTNFDLPFALRWYTDAAPEGGENPFRTVYESFSIADMEFGDAEATVTVGLMSADAIAIRLMEEPLGDFMSELQAMSEGGEPTDEQTRRMFGRMADMMGSMQLGRRHDRGRRVHHHRARRPAGVRDRYDRLRRRGRGDADRGDRRRHAGGADSPSTRSPPRASTSSRCSRACAPSPTIPDLELDATNGPCADPDHRHPGAWKGSVADRRARGRGGAHRPLARRLPR